MDQQSNTPGARPDTSRMSEEAEGTREQQRGQSPNLKPAFRYDEAIRGLAREAQSTGTMRALVEAIAWNVAQIVDQYGQAAAAHFLERFGCHLRYHWEHRCAQAEANEAKSAGRKPS